MVKYIRTDPVTVGSIDAHLIGMRPWLIEGNLIGAKRNAQVAAIIRDCKKDAGDVNAQSRRNDTGTTHREGPWSPKSFRKLRPIAARS